VLTSCLAPTLPQQINASGEAQSTNEEHPDAGDDVDAAFGDGSYASPPVSIVPAAAQEGVETEGNATESRQREEQTEPEGGVHGRLPVF
jgi:hypothetical protein